MESVSQATFLSMESLTDSAIDKILCARFASLQGFNKITAEKLELHDKVIEVSIVPNTDTEIAELLLSTDLPRYFQQPLLKQGVEYFIRAAVGVSQITEAKRKQEEIKSAEFKQKYEEVLKRNEELERRLAEARQGSEEKKGKATGLKKEKKKSQGKKNKEEKKQKKEEEKKKPAKKGEKKAKSFK